jgi:hypothetical protein
MKIPVLTTPRNAVTACNIVTFLYSSLFGGARNDPGRL